MGTWTKDVDLCYRYTGAGTPKVTGKLLAKFFVKFYSNQIPGYRLGQAFVNCFTLNDNELFYEEDDKQAFVLIEKYVL